MAARFRNSFRKFLPSWLTKDDGEKVLYSLTALVDIWYERLRQGIRARFPDYAPDDAIGLIGRDRKIVRGIEEPKEAYAARLIRAPDDHRSRGNAWAMLGQLRAYCQADIVARTVDANGNWYTVAADGSHSYLLSAGNWDWGGEVVAFGEPSLWGGVLGTPWGGPEYVMCAAMWSRFWILLFPVGVWTSGPDFGDADLWGGALGTSGYTLGSTATPDEIRALRQIARDWKPDGTRAMYIILAFSSGDFEPTDASPPNPDGDWNEPDNRILNACYLPAAG